MSEPGSLESRSPQIAELVRAKEAAEAANEAKSRYLMAISHEIRSPLNAIYGYAQLLERGDAVSGVEAGAAIRRSVDHLTNLAESLLEISWVESGVVKVRSEVIDIHATLAELVSMFQAQAIAKGLRLDLDIADNLPVHVKSDQRRLRQVLINLISNAIKYTEVGGVRISARYRSQVATIEVSDSGIGMDPDELARVFEPFERGSSKSVQSQPGVGLGLTITRVLARIMGGEITATSTPGEGSRFQVKLMLATPSTPADEPHVRAPVESYQGLGVDRTILLIDDDPDQRAAMRSLLLPLGFAVLVAGTGIEGIELAAQHSPDLVLLDLQMPELDGRETAERLRRTHGEGLKIIMLSAEVMDEKASNPDGQVHDAFIAKPVACDTLFATIARQLNLEWRYEKPPATTTARRSAPSRALADARPILDRLGKSARIGHVLEVEEQIADFEREFPEQASFSAMLREHLDNFEFGSILKMIDNV